MKYLKLLIKGCIALFLLAIASVKIHSLFVSTNVSMVGLLSNPLWNHGNKIRTIGYLELEFEGNAIYLDKEFCQRRISKNAIWIQATNEMLEDKEYLNRNYVLIEGTYDYFNQGHFSLFTGSIKDITRIEVWPFEEE